ncbi:glycosyltransferase family 4 protein [uncultured Clostridium sp.]|uniref:glycosyltransferase family 4 protein n=1 Tax=uncultured Clostridium sp. TaxID=59620 RepID=UPI00261E6239|nr:glycosyltransferase family 4 protein [uncultured Clostridium sp.]
MKIGLMTEKNTKLKGGPKVFMSRLESELKNKELYSDVNFSKWINLSFREMPKEVLANQKIEKIVRFDGIWNDSVIPMFKYMPNIKNKMDLIFFKKMNKVILDNYEKADKLIYQSKFSEYTIENLLFNRFGVENLKKESTIIYNGVDLKKFKPMLEERNKENFPNILISHRLIPFKRANQSIKVVEKLKEKYPNLKVHVIGGGVKNPYHFYEDTKERFIREVKQSGLEKFYEFYGHIDPNELPKFYNKCDFMLNLSYADPCPNVVIEAIACGLPVIAPNTGGIPELVKCKDLIVEENIKMEEFQPRFIYKDIPMIDADKYVERIAVILKKLDYYSNLMRNIAEENYDIEVVTEKYLEFIGV